MQIGDHKIYILVIDAAPTVHYSRVEVLVIEDRTLHSCQSESLFLAVAVATNLHAHRADETRVEDLKSVICGFGELTVAEELRKCQRSTGLTTADHSAVEDESWLHNGTIFLECLLDSLYELDLTRVGLDVESGEESVVAGVIDQLRMFDDDCLVGVVVVFLEVFDAEFEVEDECG